MRKLMESIDKINEDKEELNEMSIGDIASWFGVAAIWGPLLAFIYYAGREMGWWKKLDPRLLMKDFRFKKAFESLKNDDDVMNFLNDESNFKSNGYDFMSGRKKIFHDMVRGKMEEKGFEGYWTSDGKINKAKKDYRKWKGSQEQE